VAGLCDAHPMASAVARIAALGVAAAQSQPIVATARTLARPGVVKPYRIAILTEKNLVIALAALARHREAHDFNTEVPG
jgi:Mn-dependent DtxR family transcriptional regulator